MTGTQSAWPRLKPAQRLRFLEGPRYFWTVRAVSEDARFAVCTTAKWAFYTVIDWQRGHRGTENLVFGRDCKSDQDARAMLVRLTSGKTAVSHRNWVWLRFHDSQPDQRSREQLPELLRGVFDAWTRQPEPYNGAFKDKPWSQLGPVAEALWNMLARELVSS